jgi:hypothetical protein
MLLAIFNMFTFLNTQLASINDFATTTKLHIKANTCESFVRFNILRFSM